MKTFKILMIVVLLACVAGCNGEVLSKLSELKESGDNLQGDVTEFKKTLDTNEGTAETFRIETRAEFKIMKKDIVGIKTDVIENRDQYDQFSRQMQESLATLKAAPKRVVTPPFVDPPTGGLSSLNSTLGEATKLMRGGIEAVKLLREFSDELDQLRGKGRDDGFNRRLEALEETQDNDAETRKRAAAQQSWISKHSQEMHELRKEEIDLSQYRLILAQANKNRRLARGGCKYYLNLWVAKIRYRIQEQRPNSKLDKKWLGRCSIYSTYLDKPNRTLFVWIGRPATVR